jgi:hypothetical protein
MAMGRRKAVWGVVELKSDDGLSRCAFELVVIEYSDGTESMYIQLKILLIATYWVSLALDSILGGWRRTQAMG